MSDKKKDRKDKQRSEASEIFRQFLRHPFALLLMFVQLLACLTCSYVSGVQASSDSAKKVSILVRKRSLKEFPFAPAEKRFYYTLTISGQTVVGKEKIPFSAAPLDELRWQKGQVNILAELPVSIPAYPLAAAFFAVFALALARVLEIPPPRNKAGAA
jgi:hypothetical protein